MVKYIAFVVVIGVTGTRGTNKRKLVPISPGNNNLSQVY